MELLSKEFKDQLRELTINYNESIIPIGKPEFTDSGYIVKLIDRGAETHIWVQTLPGKTIYITIHQFIENDEPTIVDNNDVEELREYISRYSEYICVPRVL